jgi:hypothetical protein
VSGIRAAKLLQLRPCTASLIDVLKELDKVVEIQFFNYSLKSVYDGTDDPHLVFFSTEASFASCGEVNSRNSRYWSAENFRTCSRNLSS